MSQFVVTSDVDRDILLSQGVPASMIVSPAQASPGAVWAGAAGNVAPAGAQVLEGQTRVQTAQMTAQYLANANQGNITPTAPTYTSTPGGTSTPTYVYSDDVDKQILLNAGVPASQLVDINSGQAPAGAVWVGAAANYAPAGSTTIEGQTRVETAQLVGAYTSNVTSANATAQTNATSAKAIIANLLDPLGLGDLADWAWTAWNTSGGSIDYITSQLPNQPAFQARFPEYAVLAARGDAMSPAQIVAAEQQYASQLQQYGLSGMPGYDTQTVTAKLLEGNVSPTEFDARLQARQAAAAQYHPDVAAQLNMFGINGDAALTAYVTDPTNALPMIQQQIQAAQDAAKGVSAGFGQINADQAMKLSGEGVTQDQAQTGFAQLATLDQLRKNLPGQANPALSDDTLLNAQFASNAPDQQKVQAAQARQQGYFSQNGQFVSTQSGITGAGSANR